jgi:hypothetical protein
MPVDAAYSGRRIGGASVPTRRHGLTSARLIRKSSRSYHSRYGNGMTVSVVAGLMNSVIFDPFGSANGGAKPMKYLLSSVAIVAALAITAPVSAQRSGPGAGAGESTGPGVNPPGGPGPSSPLSNLPSGSPGIPGQPQTRMLGVPPPPPGAQAMPGMAPGSEATSAAPPSHRHARHHGTMAAAHHHGRAMPVSGNPNTSANQLNADELSRLQAGNTGNPPPSALPYGQPPGGAMPPAH